MDKNQCATTTHTVLRTINIELIFFDLTKNDIAAKYS